MSSAIRPFELRIPQDELDDLRSRLARTRWPDKECVDDWSQGAPLAKVQALCDYWLGQYDWRRCEALLNEFGQYKAEIDGLAIHFLHVKSPHPGALPLLMTHGWPGSVMEFAEVIGPLTDPVAFGGAAHDAFDVVVPSLPGYGFSSKPVATGWDVKRTADAWIELMNRLGYKRWLAQGGDWGAIVTTAIGAIRPAGCAAIHLNMPLVFPVKEDRLNCSPEEKAELEANLVFQAQESSYAKQQATRPQTLGYGLADSPAGQAAWIYEKMRAWTDNSGDPESTLSYDQMLDNIMLYWLPSTGASSARMYWESFSKFRGLKVDIPVGVSLYPKEIFKPSRRWADKYLSNIVYWNTLDRGGHFAAWEQPELFVEEIRACFRGFR